MTIAACYVSSEGVVMGADSTATFVVPDPTTLGNFRHQHFDSTQKLFEIGEHSTAGIVMWGLGGIGRLSYRSLIADVEAEARRIGTKTLREVVDLFNKRFWAEYQKMCAPMVTTIQKKTDPSEANVEKRKMERGLSGGFCIGGRWGSQHTAEAWVITFRPFMTTLPVPTQLTIGQWRLWGWENLVERVIFGIDQEFYGAVLKSGHWTGTSEELARLVRSWAPTTVLPIREAIDWVHSMVYTAIKAMKFSPFPNFCGGPIEVAAITTDRDFRWIRHKRLDEALGQDPRRGCDDL